MRPGARPGPVLGSATESRSDGVVLEVWDGRQQVGLVEQEGAEALPPQLTRPDFLLRAVHRLPTRINNTLTEMRQHIKDTVTEMTEMRD
jgi:hypothetical protein